jgi:hypothetical protein
VLVLVILLLIMIVSAEGRTRRGELLILSAEGRTRRGEIEITMPAAHAENRNMVFPKQRGAVACYRHEKFKPSPDSAVDDFQSSALALGPSIQALR